jgi:hypothetical protein
MKTRITITIDPETHRPAKTAARSQKTSVSGLIESLLRSAAPPPSRSLVDRLIGSASLRAPEAGTDSLYDALSVKYLKA